ncbi:hypothetical protein CEP81_11915 [Kocuria rhizophila]|nr:hypothetical protein CEP81_11915 [Kocuria rhizophila]
MSALFASAGVTPCACGSALSVEPPALAGLLVAVVPWGSGEGPPAHPVTATAPRTAAAASHVRE